MAAGHRHFLRLELGLEEMSSSLISRFQFLVGNVYYRSNGCIYFQCSKRLGESFHSCYDLLQKIQLWK